MKELKEVYDTVCSMSLRMKREFTSDEFNSFIAVGFLPGAPIEKLIGRVVQVREESGLFGSNQIFIRCCNGELQCHENQWFYKVPESFIPKLTEIFKEVEIDPIGKTYSIQEKYKRKGFIIPSKIKKGQTTPMREIKKSIMKNIIAIALLLVSSLCYSQDSSNWMIGGGTGTPFLISIKTERRTKLGEGIRPNLKNMGTSP